ncbi:MAG: hypothetical protein Q8J65_01600, partial [Nitrosomonadales bacterium]|nr:hypothetical protein [Nitrosomonadales bacterium]
MTRLLVLLIGLLLSSVAGAETKHATDGARLKIMVVDFELRDVSPIPNVAAEVERTALVGRVINDLLSEHGYQLMAPCDALKKVGDQGMGYLFDRPE